MAINHRFGEEKTKKMSPSGLGRRRALSLAFGGFFASAFGLSPKLAQANQAQTQTLSLINNYRKSKGLNALNASSKLNRAAQLHAEDVARRYARGQTQISGHKGSDGSSLGTRAKRQGYRFRKIVENFAYDQSPDRAVRAWINSPGHNRNLLNRSIREGGIGVKNGIYIFVGGKSR